jgi:hypothetical protein
LTCLYVDTSLQSAACTTLCLKSATKDPLPRITGAKFESANMSVPGTMAGADQGPLGSWGGGGGGGEGKEGRGEWVRG